MTAEHLFLTGGTGFVGANLLRRWLEATDARATLLVRERYRQPPLERVQEILKACRCPLSPQQVARVDFVAGDLCSEGLGAAAGDRDRLAGEITHIVHCAAAVRFNLPLQQARRINTDGTRRVLELASHCHRLRRFCHIGTAYVAGRRRGVVGEDELRAGVGFNNTYEQSKHEAEALVRSAFDRIPTVILRPSIVTSCPASGFVPASSALFRILAAIATGRVQALPGEPDTRLDMVPIDFLAEGAVTLGRHPESAGKCYHLTAGPEASVRLGELVELAREAFAVPGLELVPPREFSSRMRSAHRLPPSQTSLAQELEIYAPYLASPLQFDNSRARAVLDGSRYRIPPIRDYFDRMAEFVRRAVRPPSR